MDYAFVPGIGDPATDVLRAVLALRANTVVDKDAGVVTVQDFLSDVAVILSAVGVPADDLIAGSHGSAEGQLQIRLDLKTPTTDPNKPPITVYEDLEAVNTSGTIRIPPEIKSPNTSFRLAGCLIGSDECLPFLQLLKQALGNPKNVSAPRYIHAFNTAPDGSSAFEFMNYAFRTVSKEPLKSRDSVVGSFGNLPDDAIRTLDGTPVDGDKWDQWVPVAAKLKLDPTTSQELPVDFPVKVSPASGGMTAIYKDLATWYSTIDSFDFKVHITGTIPDDDAGKIALVPQALALVNAFKDNHPYPVFKRLHFDSRQKFVDGMNWKPTVLPNNTLQFVGRRNRYELHIPVVKP